MYFEFGQWEDYLTQVCGREICGDRVFTFEMNDGTVIPWNPVQDEPQDGNATVTLYTIDRE